MKRVTSPAPIEKPCQLMIEPGEFVTFRTLAFGCWKLTCPFTTCGPVGFAHTDGWAKRRETLAATSAQGFSLKRLPPTHSSRNLVVFPTGEVYAASRGIGSTGKPDPLDD